MITLPTHTAMRIYHNMHCIDCKQSDGPVPSVQNAIDNGYYNPYYFTSDTDCEKAIITNECWKMVWHTDYTHGISTLLSSSLTTLMEYIEYVGYIKHDYIEE